MKLYNTHIDIFSRSNVESSMLTLKTMRKDAAKSRKLVIINFSGCVPAALSPGVIQNFDADDNDDDKL